MTDVRHSPDRPDLLSNAHCRTARAAIASARKDGADGVGQTGSSKLCSDPRRHDDCDGADAIDGHWCFPDGRRISIQGPAIVTPAGSHIQGDYARHFFRYVVPPADPDPGQTVFMALVNEDTVHLRIGAMPSYSSDETRRSGTAAARRRADAEPRTHHRCPTIHYRLAPQQTAPVGWEPELAELRARIALAKEMGGAERVARQHQGGRLTVRERIDRMLDPGSFHEIGATAGKATYDADSRRDRRLHAGQLRVRARHRRWPPGGGRRRRLHPARRVGGRLDQGQAEDVGADRGRVPHADHPADRRLRRRRLGEDDRDHRARQPAGRAVGDHLVRPGGEQHGGGAGGGAGPGVGRRASVRRGSRPATTR